MTKDEIIGCLTHAYEAGRFAQAYAVVGPPRHEGRDIVDHMASLLFCENHDARPCGTCKGCVQGAAHTHPDLQWVEPQKRSRAISVDQVRALQARIYQTAYVADWKVCAIVGADRMNEQAANAFLKTLEEPPAGSVCFLLTDAPQFLLPTIISRCQIVTASTRQQSLPEAREAALVEILAGRPGSGGVITAFARADRLSALLKTIKDETLAAEKALAAESGLEEKKETLDARANARYRELRTGMMRSLMLWYRDILLVACGGDPAGVHYSENQELLQKRGAGVTYKQAMENVKAIDDMNRQLERNMPESRVLAPGFCRLMG